MHLLRRALGIPEELSLRDMVFEFSRFKTSLDSCHLLWIINISALRRLGWGGRLPPIWPVISFAFSNCVTLLAVPILVHKRTDRAIDRKLLPIDTKSRKLSIEVRKISSLEERIVGETNARNNMASCESSLLGLSEILVNVTVEFELANIPNRYEFLGPYFGRIEYVEVEVMLL